MIESPTAFGLTPLVELRGTTVHFVQRRGLWGKRGEVHALDDVSLAVDQGETLGVVGETGCGKSTLGRVVAGLIKPTTGEVLIEGVPVVHRRPGGAAKALGLQMVFQDPAGSLNPRRSVESSIGEPLRNDGLRGRDVRARVYELLDDVSLPPTVADRFPSELSGGQQQRVAIARALASQPRLVVLDEAVSALDTSTQAQVLNLLLDLRERHRLTYIFISHDIEVVRFMSTRIAVMYLGQLVELGPADTVEATGLHPYTVCLASSVPLPDPARERERARYTPVGVTPSPLSPPSGCRFHTRCPVADERCETSPPPLIEHFPGRIAACHFAGLFHERYTDGHRTSTMTPGA